MASCNTKLLTKVIDRYLSFELSTRFGDEKSVNSHLKLALKAAIKDGSLQMSDGTGALVR